MESETSSHESRSTCLRCTYVLFDGILDIVRIHRSLGDTFGGKDHKGYRNLAAAIVGFAGDPHILDQV